MEQRLYWGYVRAILGLYWGYVGLYWGYVRAMSGHNAGVAVESLGFGWGFLAPVARAFWFRKKLKCRRVKVRGITNITPNT